MSGFVKIYRSILESPVFKNDEEAMAFAWLVLRASWKDTRVRYKERMISLKRGQLALSSRDFAQHWEWSEARCRRFLNRLKSDAAIDAQSDAGVTVITICNYGVYQGDGREDDAPTDAQVTQERRTTDAQNNEEKKRRKKESIKGKTRRSQIGEGVPNDDDRAKAVEHWRNEGVVHLLDIDDQIQRFRDHHMQKGSLMANWSAAWSTWFRNAARWKLEDMEKRGEQPQFGNLHRPNLSDDEWRENLNLYVNDKVWRAVTCGPRKPDEEGNAVPRHLLIEFGFLDGDLFGQTKRG